MDDSTKEFIKSAIAGQVRHVLTGAAGALVVNGAIQSSQTDAFVSIGGGIVMYGIGAVWSWWQKDGQALVAARLAKLKRHVDAIPAPSPVTPVSGAGAIILAKQVASEPTK